MPKKSWNSCVLRPGLTADNMNVETVLFLLLPVAAASGWLLARRQESHSNSETSRLPPDYFRGLSYLLDDQHDKAIDIFIRMLEEDSETVELHLAVGNLFRNRGEVDRAIRIHQNLVNRTALSDKQRIRAKFELGEDYMRAGLLDGAEDLFQEMVEKGEYLAESLHHLIDIFQQEKDWRKAIEAGFKLEQSGVGNVRPMIAQHYCELTEEARRKGDLKQAQQILKHARATWPQCVRASLVEGSMAMEAGRYEEALLAFQRVEQQDADYLPEVIPVLHECYQQLGVPQQMQDYLQTMVERYGGLGTMLALAAMICEQQGGEQAATALLGYLDKYPSLRGLDQFVELVSRCGDVPEQQMFAGIGGVTSRLVEGDPDYLCNNCGFQGKVLHWQCPSCKSWGTVKPLHGIQQNQQSNRILSLVVP